MSKYVLTPWASREILYEVIRVYNSKEERLVTEKIGDNWRTLKIDLTESTNIGKDMGGDGYFSRVMYELYLDMDNERPHTMNVNRFNAITKYCQHRPDFPEIFSHLIWRSKDYESDMSLLTDLELTDWELYFKAQIVNEFGILNEDTYCAVVHFLPFFRVKLVWPQANKSNLIYFGSYINYEKHLKMTVMWSDPKRKDIWNDPKKKEMSMIIMTNESENSDFNFLPGHLVSTSNETITSYMFMLVKANGDSWYGDSLPGISEAGIIKVDSIEYMRINLHLKTDVTRHISTHASTMNVTSLSDFQLNNRIKRNSRTYN